MKSQYEKNLEQRHAEYCKAAMCFLSDFEAVFGHDWSFTKTAIERPEHLIADDGTFIEPNVEDESNNWANRRCLLNSYRRFAAIVGAERNADRPKTVERELTEAFDPKWIASRGRCGEEPNWALIGRIIASQDDVLAEENGKTLDDEIPF